MRTIMMALAMICFGAPALAASPLQGKWKIVAPSEPSVSGFVVIDAENRAMWNSLDDVGPERWVGYVAESSDPTVQIVFTDGDVAIRAHCLIQNHDLLRCRLLSTAASKHPTETFSLARVGLGPENLRTRQDSALQGRWRIETDTSYAYSAVITIEANGDAALTASWATHGSTAAGTAKAIGYVRVVGQKIEIVFTKREPPSSSWDDRATCVARSDVSIECTTPNNRKMTLEKLAR